MSTHRIERAEIRLRRLREHIDRSDDLRGQTQDSIAEALGLPNGSYLSRLYHRRKRLSADKARDIEHRRGMTENWLEGDAKAERLAESILHELPISEEAAAIGRKWAALDEPLRSQIAALFDTLTERQLLIRRVTSGRRQAARHAKARV